MRARAKAVRPAPARPAPARSPDAPALVHSPPASYSNALAALAPPQTPIAATAIAGVAHASAPLPHLDRIQAAFGAHDVRHVRSAIGGAAGSAAMAIGARAYAVGDRVAFRSEPDLHLAAHEAAHVVQQRAGVSLDDGVGHAGDVHEQHADAVADAVVAGESAEELLGVPTSAPAPRQGVQMACACGTCAACVQRADENAAALAPTPGGLRVGALDPTKVQEAFDKVLPGVQAQDLGAVERAISDYIDRGVGSDESIDTTANRDALHGAVLALDSAYIDSGLKQQAKKDLFDDVAVLIARSVQQAKADKQAKIDAASVARDLPAIASTYARLAYIYGNETIEYQSQIAPDALSVDQAFRARSQLFLDYAKTTYGVLTPGMVRVQQGLAADLSRLAAGEFQFVFSGGGKVLAPDRGAELLVYQMLEPDPPRLDLLQQLFAQVYASLRTPGETDLLLDKTMRQSFQDIVTDPVTEQLQQAAFLGPDAIEAAKRELSKSIGRFLARLDDDNAAEVTGWFISAMASYGAKIPDDVQKQLETAEEALSAPAPAPPVPAQPQQPAKPRCTITYSPPDVQAFLDARVPVKKNARKHDVTFEPRAVMCQFAQRESDALLAATTTNLAQWAAAALRIATDLRTHYDEALARDTEIRADRAKLSHGKDKDRDPPPDLVDQLGQPGDFWSRLWNVADERPFDPSDIEGKYEDLAVPYFHGLQRHQEVLLRGLKLLLDTEASHLDLFLKDRYPNTHALTYAFMKAHLLGEEIGGDVRMIRWPGPWQLLTGDTDHPVKQDSEGLLVQIRELEQIIANATADKRAEHRAELEHDIYWHMDLAVRRVRARLGDKVDRLRADDVLAALKDWIRIPAEDEKDALEIVAAALGDVHAARYAQLQSEAIGARISGDLGKATDRARRMQELRDELSLPVPPGEPEQLLAVVRGESTSLIGLWAMAESSWVMGLGSMQTDTPGIVVRAANLLRLGLKNGKATIGEAYEWVKGRDFLDWQIASLEDRDYVIAGSVKGTKDWFSTLGGWGLQIVEALDLLDTSYKSRALRFMIDAENAKSDDERKAAIAALAQAMGAKSASHSKTVGQYIYSFLLDATDELQDASDKADQDLAEAEEARKKLDEAAVSTKPKTAEDLKQEAAWKAAVAKVTDLPLVFMTPHDALESVESEKREKNIVAVFDAGKHPIHDNRKLTNAEKHWWSEYKRLGSFSQKGWAEMKEWGEGVLTTFAVGIVTGGIGDVVAGGLELGLAETTVLKTAMFTESMRVIQDIQTGQSPSTSFTEDLVVNLAMHGATEFAAGRMARALEASGIKLTSITGRVGMFAAEYIATSGVGLAHLYLGSMIRGHAVTQKEVDENLLSNFSFLVGMKAMHAFVEAPKAVFLEEARTWQDPDVAAKYKALNENLKPYDDEFQKAAEELAKTPDAADRKALLDHQADILDAKAKVIESSDIPDANKVAEDYRFGIQTFRADIQRASTLEGVGARPLDGKDSPHLSYERGSANEAALEAMFKENNQAFTSVERADGSKVYNVYTAEGFLRYEPRDPGDPGSGASQKEAYAKTTRIAGEVIPGKTGASAEKLESGEDVSAIVGNSGARSARIPQGVGEEFVLRAGNVDCLVTFKVAERLTSRADHEAGPATYRLTMNANGEWEATVTVRKSAPNDHVVRGVNHEVEELAKVIERLEARASSYKGGREAYKNQQTLNRAMQREVSGDPSKDPKTGLSAHTLATFNADVRTVLDQSAEIVNGLQSLRPGESSAVLDERRKNNDNDVGALLNLLDLPVAEDALRSRLKELEAQGVDTKAVLALKQMWVSERTGYRFTPIDMQILYAEFNKANPNTVPEATYSAFIEYYERKVREKVDRAVANARKQKGATEQSVRAAAMKEALRDTGGTSVASLRGRFFEGKYIDEFNSDPQRVSDQGRLYAIPSNNYPTYDIAGIRIYDGNAAVSAKGAVTPLRFATLPDSSTGVTVQLLHVYDANGKEVAYQTADGKFVVKDPDHVELWVASLKAKDRLQITEMRKAIGTPADPTGQTMVVTQNGKEWLKRQIKNKAAAAERAKQGGNMDEFRRIDKQRRELEFFDENVEVDDDLRNEDIDEMIELLKSIGLDKENIVRGATATQKAPP